MQGPCLVEWMPNVDVRTALPSRRVHMPRAYTHVAYEPMAGLVVGAASLHAQFASYDEDGALLWEPDGGCSFSYRPNVC
jgi:cleavage and polyadenylation specificity factor subunit 1